MREPQESEYTEEEYEEEEEEEEESEFTSNSQISQVIKYSPFSFIIIKLGDFKTAFNTANPQNQSQNAHSQRFKPKNI
jgi:hypothetical protein